MKYQVLYFGKNKKSILKCRLLKILPRVLSIKEEIYRGQPPICSVKEKNMIFIDNIILQRKRNKFMSNK